MNAILEIGQQVWFWNKTANHWEVLHGTVKTQPKPECIIPAYDILPDGMLDVPENYMFCARRFIYESQIAAYASMLEHMDEEVIQRTRELRERSEELLNLELDTSRQRQTYYQLKRKEQI
jgi:hypothetical protein